MTAHYSNILKIEDIRVKHGAYISAKPLVFFTEKEIFIWEIQYRSGSWVSYGYQEEKPEILTYEQAISDAIKYFEDHEK